MANGYTDLPNETSATSATQQSPTGVTTAGFTVNSSANAVFAESTFTGNFGSTQYTVSDLVRALKKYGIIVP